ncbi:MAG TPA: hypothetical protein EYH50_00140 [Pyrodictium delaneyi]|uniref:Uncharacterized protein n=1 Tax=Pyrodictium delaneyi TaxID=1273541 RepID=A0A833EAB2_9CREN|nr:hypothetical protein [Pyrodictium delaneyi]
MYGVVLHHPIYMDKVYKQQTGDNPICCDEERHELLRNVSSVMRVRVAEQHHIKVIDLDTARHG